MSLIKLVLFSKENCENCVIVSKLFSQLDVKHEKVKLKSLKDIIKHVVEPDNEQLYELKSFPVLQIGVDRFIQFDEILQVYNEPLLIPNQDVDTIFPIKYSDLWDAYERSVASFWTTKEIDFSKDEKDWEKLTDNEKYFIKHILAFFAGSDGIVNENLINNFSSEIQVPEARAFYSYQQFNETIHSETYSLLIDNYVKDRQEKIHLLRGIHTIPSIQKKALWCKSYINRDNCPSFAMRLIAFACVEGILFSGSFCAIFWLKKRGLLPGLCFSNELISRDEGAHLNFAVMLFNKLTFKPSQQEVHAIVSEAVTNEIEFINQSIPCAMIGMNSALMTDYIKFVADRFLKSIHYSILYDVSNPFDFMENISIQGKTNFFEKKVAEYSLAGALSTDNKEFSLDAEF
jgi:ribonucleoside-diphosphate reductase subunit M2